MSKNTNLKTNSDLNFNGCCEINSAIDSHHNSSHDKGNENNDGNDDNDGNKSNNNDHTSNRNNQVVMVSNNDDNISNLKSLNSVEVRKKLFESVKLLNNSKKGNIKTVEVNSNNKKKQRKL
jgi:hypothetical protein